MQSLTESPDNYARDVPVPPDLAEQLRQAMDDFIEARERRDRLICEAHAAGASLRAIAAALDNRITHVGIKRIVERAK